MEFFEGEFRKLLTPDAAKRAVFAGRTCYVPLDWENAAKIEFGSEVIKTQLDKLHVSIISREKVVLDEVVLRFSELLGRKPVEIKMRESASITPYKSMRSNRAKMDEAFAKYQKDHLSLQEFPPLYVRLEEEKTPHARPLFEKIRSAAVRAATVESGRKVNVLEPAMQSERE